MYKGQGLGLEVAGGVWTGRGVGKLLGLGPPRASSSQGPPPGLRRILEEELKT